MLFQSRMPSLFQKVITGVLIFQFACPASVVFAATATTSGSVGLGPSPEARDPANWHIEFDRDSSTAVIWTGQKAIALPVAKTVTRIAADADTIYLFHAQRRGVELISKHEINLAQSRGNVATVGHKFMSLDMAIPKGTLTDFAAYDNGDTTVFMVSMASGEGARVYPLVVSRFGSDGSGDAAVPRAEQAAMEKAAGSLMGTQPFVGALRPDAPIEIMGNGKIALMQDPQMGGILLLALDPRQNMVHEYGATNPLGAIYLRSHVLPDPVKALGLEVLNDSVIDTLGAPGASFRLSRAGKNPLALSVLRLRETLALRRNIAINEWHRQAVGNEWTNQLLAWGRLSLVVDALDRAYVSDDVDANSIKADPLVAGILSKVTEREFYDWAKDNQIFTAKELDQMRLEANLASGHGRKWAITTAGLMILLGVFKVRASPSVKENPIVHAKAYLWAFGEKLLMLSGRSPEQLAAFRAWGASKQLRFKGSLMRNALIHQHPLHLIGKLEARLGRFARKTGSTEVMTQSGRPVALFDRTRPIDDRVKAILESWEQLRNVPVSGSTRPGAGLLPGNTARAQSVIAKEASELAARENLLKADSRLQALKVRILVTIEKARSLRTGTPTQSIDKLRASDEGKALLNSSDEAKILEQARLARQALEEMKRLAPTQLRVITARAGALGDDVVRQTVSGAEQAAKAAEKFGGDGKSNAFFTLWAQVAESYSRYFLPLSVRKVVGLESNFAKRWARMDLIEVNGQFQRIPVSGTNARDAITFGTADVGLETYTQYNARGNSVDPNERIWGSSDNHFALIPWGGKKYGPHFDLISDQIQGIWGWSMRMPQVYASMDVVRGGAGVTLFKREWNQLKKSPVNFVFRSFWENWAAWAMSSSLILKHYESTHNLKDCATDRGCVEFSSKLNYRTDVHSIPERYALGLALSKISVSPQYFLQSQVNQVLPMLTGAARIPLLGWSIHEVTKNIYGMLIMPYATSYGIARWQGSYFGFNNPDTIEVMRAFQIDGILSKIDAQGYTNVESWTEQEQLGFLQMMTLLALAKQADQKPLAENATPEQAAKWFADIYAQVFAGAEKAAMPKDGRSFRVQVLPPAAQRMIQPTANTQFGEQAKQFRAMMEQARKNTALLPLEDGRNEQVALQVMEPTQLATVLGDTGERIEVQQLQSLMQDLNRLNATVTANLARMKNDSREVNRLHQASDRLLAYDILAGVGTMAAYRTNIGAQFAATTRKMAGRLMGTSIFATLPYGFWLGDQGEAQLRNASANGQLLKELQELLFAATEELTFRFVEIALNSPNQMQAAEQFGESIAKLEGTKKELETYLSTAQTESEELLTSRQYRIPKIAVEYGWVGPGFFGGWMLGRWTLFKASQGIITRMTDRYAPVSLGVSLLGWFYAMGVEDRMQDRVRMTTEDFFVLYQAYLSSVLQLELMKEARAAIQSRQRLDATLVGQRLRQAIENDERLRVTPDKLQKASEYRKTASDYRLVLLKLLEDDKR